VFWAGAAFLIVSWPSGGAERLEVGLLDQRILQSRLEQGLVPYDDRESTVAAMLRSTGCEVELQKVSRKTNNVICTLAGESRDAIVIGGHYDYVPEGKGIIDDWSGVSMLASLYQSIQGRPRKHTFVFVAFAKEETGLEGSRKYVHELGRDGLAHVRAFVNLECLGTSPMKVWRSRADPALFQKLERMAASFHTSVPSVNVDKVGDDDSHPFMNAGVPVITLHSITQDTLLWIHNKKDHLESIHPQEYYDSYKLIAFYLASLDSEP
jgi:Zn-dependent M28 family amino/carboxypeptidase